MTQHHSISGLVGKLVVESEVNCSADKYYEMFKQHEGIPPAIPHIYTGVNVIEGHGTTSGCIIQWNYIVESKNEFVHTDSPRLHFVVFVSTAVNFRFSHKLPNKT
ncbi:hypothetical protein MKW92_032348 [Papaver armeniacum]|nr:hypothetical protein MKW92_032348 [Papaver armeniacum]